MKNLNYHHLQYFWEVAKTGNLTKAAQRLMVAQSALSTQIKHLEAELGGELFLREGKALHLTGLGRVVLDYAETIFVTGEELLASVRAAQTTRVQEVRVGCVSTLSRNFQLDFLKPMLNKPHLRWELHAGSLEELMHGLTTHQLHLVLSNQPRIEHQGRTWNCILVAQQPVSLVGKAQAQGHEISVPELLLQRPLLLPSRKSEMRMQFDRLCLRNNWHLSPSIEIDDMAMMRLLARDLDCVAVLPAIVVKDELQSNLLQEYFKFPDLFESFYAITQKPKLMPKEVADHLETLRQG